MPGGGGADRIHNRLPQDVRQRPFEDIKSRQREHVDAGVVVFVERARQVHFALGPLLGSLSSRRAIRPIGLAPERPRPIARLAQQVVPGDGRVVFGGEQVDALRHVGCDAIRHITNLPLIEGDADDGRQKRFRDAERHVRPRCVAPLRDDSAAMDDDAVAASSRLGWPDQRIVGRLVSKLLRNGNGQILRVRILVGDGKCNRFIQLRLVGGILLPPLAARRKVAFRRLFAGGAKRRGGEQDHSERARDPARLQFSLSHRALT